MSPKVDFIVPQQLSLSLSSSLNFQLEKEEKKKERNILNQNPNIQSQRGADSFWAEVNVSTSGVAHLIWIQRKLDRLVSGNFMDCPKAKILISERPL